MFFLLFSLLFSLPYSNRTRVRNIKYIYSIATASTVCLYCTVNRRARKTFQYVKETGHCVFAFALRHPRRLASSSSSLRQYICRIKDESWLWFFFFPLLSPVYNLPFSSCLFFSIKQSVSGFHILTRRSRLQSFFTDFLFYFFAPFFDVARKHLLFFWSGERVFLRLIALPSKSKLGISAGS